MNHYVIVDALDLLSDDLLEQHMIEKQKRQNPANKILKRPLIKWSATIAACVTLIVLAHIFLPFKSNHGSNGGCGSMSHEISNSEVVYKGIPLTDQEISDALTSWEEDILNEVSAHYGLEYASIRISTYGVHHVAATQSQNILRLDFITYYVIDEQFEILAEVTIFRDGTNLNRTLSLRGSNLQKINEIFRKDPTTDFVMVYIGDSLEAMIAPNNTIYFLNEEKIVTTEQDYYTLLNQGLNLLSKTLLAQA